MRLIDADALKHEISGSIPMMPTVRISIEHKIDAAPTVNAIPVEWLEEKKRWASADGDNECVWVIGYLIDRWQKEQEAR